MNYKVILSASLFLLLISMDSCAQSKYGIRKTDAFFTERLPGNIPVDENGRSLYHGPDTINTVYLETRGASIKWIAAWKDGRSFSIITLAIKNTPFEVGINKITNKKILLKPSPGNKLWLLELQKTETSSKPPVKMKTGGIILQGRSGGKIFIQRIGSQTELTSIPSV